MTLMWRHYNGSGKGEVNIFYGTVEYSQTETMWWYEEEVFSYS